MTFTPSLRGSNLRNRNQVYAGVMEQQQPRPAQRVVSLSSDRLSAVGDAVDDAVAVVKPKLRGWLHAGTTPLALAAGIVLIALAPTAPSRASAGAARAADRRGPTCSRSASEPCGRSASQGRQ